MNRTLLVVITGPPATGKTCLGKLLARKYFLPYFSKDIFKEMMFDRAGDIDWEASRFYSKTSIDTLNIITKELLSNQVSHIVEAIFKTESHTPYLQALKNEFAFDLVQVQLKCEGQVLTRRFKERATSGELHPGHQGLRFFEHLKHTLAKGEYEPFEIDSEIIYVDTTDLSKVDYDFLFKTIESKML